MVDQTDPAVRIIWEKNKAKEHQMKKELREKIKSFADTGSLPQLTEIFCEIERLRLMKK